MRLGSTLMHSCEEEALKKINELRESIAKGEMDSKDKFQEIEQIFRELRTAMHKHTTELLEDTQGKRNDRSKFFNDFQNCDHSMNKAKVR